MADVVVLKLQIDIELSFTYYIIDERSSPNSFWVISYTFFVSTKLWKGGMTSDERRETSDERIEARGEQRVQAKPGPRWTHARVQTDRQTDKQTDKQTVEH